MRLKLAHRLILYIGSLLMVFFGVAVFFFSLRFNQLMIREEGVPFFSLARLGLLTGAALTIAFGVFCVTLPHRMKQGRTEFVTQKTQSGELKISVQAIESIVHKSLSEHEEIKLRQLKVTNTRAGIEVDVKAALAGNINIPLAVNAIQKYIRHSLSTTLSIDAREVRVIVVSADIQAKDSPYLIPKTALDMPKKEAKAEATRPDQHQ
ncbi:MAG: alkaline shock response membrane anchor protein AmaP [Clostridiales bacterium]|nr:alkaline shock response membrane anchor protein AmaP [Clostridiales bacterium]